ncbi:hypothetical protein LEMA_P067220.1 [Plenodomus lingam JN3]|uniref:Uncharacterized protein n=1 Tax=Leptosphaeria maculans (strain JN3 / isolate v23.1.3 / race Av1-4-5-6-7-8) TaxID=985895 RepID=E4ZIU4_LEPMJ|nr:hypothetical protein LEMA_P067220.1 [Plenodomus lingam JN3]CBX91214.1 hypothetical protein LEMA_P067220.1 [Plenodomus lingam JN3]
MSDSKISPNLSKRFTDRDLVAAFNIFWNDTAKAQATFESQHEHGAKKRMRNVQDFGETAADMMRQLEPIVQVIKDFGAPFGGMAIAQTKASIERQVAETLHQIRHRIPGFRVYERIYNDDHELDQQLQSQIVTAYDTFIQFCIASTKYYSRRGMGRWLRAFIGPATSIVEQASRVQICIVDVRQTTEELLNKSVDTIKHDNKELRKQIQQLQDNHDSDRLNHVQSFLSLETSSRELDWATLEKYQRELDLHFEDWIYVELMTKSKLAAFENDPAIQAWQHSCHSQMLLLVGYNDRSYYDSIQCWLSPVALHIIRHIRSIGEADAYTFQLIGQREPRSFQHILSTIIFQLLKQNYQLLRNQEHYAGLFAELQTYQKLFELSRQSGDGQDNHRLRASESLQKVAFMILNLFSPEKTIWIVLDRVDRCRSYPRSADGKKLLKSLVQLMEKATVKVRVLAVINGYDWPVDNQVDELGCSQPERICCMRIEQGQLVDRTT